MKIGKEKQQATMTNRNEMCTSVLPRPFRERDGVRVKLAEQFTNYGLQATVNTKALGS